MIFVDKLFSATVKGQAAQFWCHMASDGDLDDLHAFARSIGLKREWFQAHARMPHYDLTETSRNRALVAGAMPVSAHMLVIACSIRYPTDPPNRQLLYALYDKVKAACQARRCREPRYDLLLVAHQPATIYCDTCGEAANVESIAVAGQPADPAE